LLHKEAFNRWFWIILDHWLFKIIMIGLTLVPVLNICYIVGSTGANNLSVDYVETVWIVDSVLRGTYDWTNFLEDTFVVGSHSKAIPTLVRILLARWFDWNVYAELYLIVGLAVLKLVLIHSSFTYLAKCPVQILLWPILSALVFSVSQISVFSYGDTGTWMGLVQLGLLLGIWGMVRYSERWVGFWLMLLGGVVATLSGGSGPIVWPVFLIGIVLLGFHKWFFYTIWLGVGLLASSPYIIFRFFRSIPQDSALSFSFPQFEVFVEAVSWPFSEKLHQLHVNEAVGWLGLGFGLVGILILIGFRSRLVWRQSSAAIMLLLYALLNMVLLNMFRGTQLPWYTGHHILYWIGLIGLAYLLLILYHPNRTFRTANVVWSTLVFGFIGIFFFNSNLTYTDKVFFLFTRSPASATCLRAYQTAPTYCEQPLFPVNPGRFEMVAALARPLQRSKLSVFAPQQRWTLQGDFILDNVTIDETAGIPEIIWTPDLSDAPLRWSDYRHLNLLLYPPNTISWTVTLPDSTVKARFHSAIAIRESGSAKVREDGAWFEVRIFTGDGIGKVVFSQHLSPDQQNWQPLGLLLDQYAGQTITIQLATKMGDNPDGDWTYYRYPYIDIQQHRTEMSVTEELVRPSNTDLSPSFSIQPTPNDFVFENLGSWITDNLEQVQTDGSGYSWRVIGRNPNMLMELPDVCLSDYTHLYIKIAVSPEIWPRAIEIYYQLDDQAIPDEIAPPMIIPLLADGKMHTYAYDLKLLDLQHRNRLTGLRLDPVSDGSSGESLVQIADFRLIRAAEPSVCVE
jgi:hypothetical protein